MSTLETQYREYLKNSRGGFCSFEQWKEIHGNQIKQALIEMMEKDEELGLYDEPFKHKVETIPAEEILANRSNAYEFIDFDKQEISYSEEEVRDIAKQAFILGKDFGLIGTFNEWFETVKKK